MPAQWKARNVAVKIGNSVTVSTAVDLWDQITAGTVLFESKCKDAELTVPEKDVSSTLLLGTDSTTNAQNEILEDAQPTEAEFTATILADTIDLEQFQMTGTASLGDGADMTRYNFGADAPATAPAVTIQFSSGTSIVNFLMNNARVVKVGGFSQEAEGASEDEILVKCAAKDLYKERNF